MPPAQMNVHSFGSARKIQTITECPPLIFVQKGRWTFWTTCNFNHFFLTHCKYEKHEHYCTKSTFYTLLCLFTWETFSAHDTNSSIRIQYWNQDEIIQICQIFIFSLELRIESSKWWYGDLTMIQYS